MTLPQQIPFPWGSSHEPGQVDLGRCPRPRGPHGPSPDAIRTAKRRARSDVGLHPIRKGRALTDPAMKCGSCGNAVMVRHGGGRFWKCKLVGVSHGPGTDIRLSWPGCEDWTAATTTLRDKRAGAR